MFRAIVEAGSLWQSLAVPELLVLVLQRSWAASAPCPAVSTLIRRRVPASGGRAYPAAVDLPTCPHDLDLDLWDTATLVGVGNPTLQTKTLKLEVLTSIHPLLHSWRGVGHSPPDQLGATFHMKHYLRNTFNISSICSALYTECPYSAWLYMQSVRILHCFVCKVSVFCIALYAKCPYSALLYMQSVRILHCFICKVGAGTGALLELLRDELLSLVLGFLPARTLGALPPVP